MSTGGLTRSGSSTTSRQPENGSLSDEVFSEQQLAADTLKRAAEAHVRPIYYES